MNRIDEINRFYELLNKLENKIGGKYLLPDCNAQMNWPRKSIYFFFEEGQVRDKKREKRVVSIGYTKGKEERDTLWACLRKHRGTVAGKYAGGGNHRDSNLRLHLGSSLINRDGIDCLSWGKRFKANAEIRAAEYSLEKMVSQKVNSMPFIWLGLDSRTGTRDFARFMEKNVIALLSNYGKAPVDGPSSTWLGNYCVNPFVQRSGLWNVEYVSERYTPAFMEEFRKLVNIF